MDTRNFVSGRSLRRQVLYELQEQQKRDSQCSERLRQVICRHTRAILNIVSGLLLSYERGNITDQDTELFQKLSPPSQTVEVWLTHREAEADATKGLSRLRQLLSSAESEYSRLAPFGTTVTGWFSDEREKAQINAARQNRDCLRRDFQQAELNHEAKLANIQSYSEHFLRKAMSPVGITALLANSRVNAKLRSALDALSRDVTEIWQNHANAQSESLAKVLSATTDLERMYQPSQTTATTILLGAANVGTRN
jgi:hypothetical protein